LHASGITDTLILFGATSVSASGADDVLVKLFGSGHGSGLVAFLS
jgi:hypothetical protein